MSELEKRIVLATGGTGGHMFPAQALATELSKQGYNVFIFSDGRGHQFSEAPFVKVKVPAAQLQGSLTRKVKGGIKLVAGLGVALYHLRRIKPHAVVGFGGYASIPTMIAAATLRLPTIVHQADACFGRANRFLAPFVTRIATSFPHVENIPTSCQEKVSLTGLPLRSDIKPSPYVASKEKGPFHLLVTGGSQGAKVFGDVLPEAVGLLKPDLQKRLHVHQQCRVEFLQKTEENYQKTQANAELSPFLDRMGERYKKAHLVISRAGASSVGEAMLVGRPALFIPYPYAMDHHQFYNAKQAVDVKGGWIVEEKDLTPKVLAQVLSDLMASPQKLEKAAAHIQTVAIPDAPLRLAHLVKMIGS